MFDSKKEVVVTSPASAPSEPARPDPGDEAGISPHPRPGVRGDGSPAAAAAETSSKGDDIGRDRSTLVNKIVEGLRGDAFLIARDLGLETLTQDGGLEQLVERIKSNVFPRAQGEAKELFRAGQKAGGVLSRQPQEPMLSCTQRRRRWWKVLTDLDPSMALSDGLRMELMLELSGLSRQEVLVVKDCAATKDFEGVAQVLVDQYSGIHVREGSKSWVGRTSTPQFGKPGKGYGSQKGSYGGKALVLTRLPMQPIPIGKVQTKVLKLCLKNTTKRTPHTQVCLEGLKSPPLTLPSQTPMALLKHTSFQKMLTNLKPCPECSCRLR